MSETENWIYKSISEGHIQFITYDSFSNVEAIARGAFGEVSRAWWNSAEKYVALKTLYTNPESNKPDNDSFQDLVNEFQLIRHVDFHDNVVRFFGLSQDPTTYRYIMVLQYANGGNLREYLRDNHGTLDWQTKIDMGKQIASGLKCIHKQDVVHRDLHSKNILVHDGKMMITDFGLSKSGITNTTSVVVGMAGYIEPKCFVDRNYRRDKKSDIYSLGVLLWEISSGRPPFNNLTILEIAEQVAKGKRESPIPGAPIDFKNLYEICWDSEPDKRPDIEEVRKRLDNIRLESAWNGPDIGDVGNRFNNMRLDDHKAPQQKQIQTPQQPFQQPTQPHINQYPPNPNPVPNTIRPNQTTPNMGHYGPGNASVQNINYPANQGMIQGGIGGGYQIPNQSGGYPPYNQSGGGYPMQNPGGLPMQNPGGRPIQNPGGRPIQNPGGYPIYNQNSGYPNPNQGAGYPNPSHGGYPIQNQGGNYPTQGPQMSYPMQDPRMAYVQRPFQNPNYPQNNKNPNYPQNNQNPNYPQNNQNPNYPQSNQNPNYPQSNQSMQMPTPPTMNNMQPSPYPQQNFKPPSRPDQPNFKPPSRPDQPNFKPPSRPDQPNTGYAAGVPPSQQIPPQYFQQRPPLQQFPMQPNQNIPNKNVMNQNVPNQNMLNQNIHIQSTQHQVPKQYSSMRPCMELLAKHADEHHSTFTGPDNCGAGYHVGYGDVVGLQFHLDNMSIPVDSDNFEFANKQEPLVLIASTYCSGRKLISILKCLKDYKADFSKFDPITKRTALHRLFENTVLRKDVTERSGGVRKYVDCVKDAIMILTSYEDVKRNCNINATDYEGKTILTCYMIDLFGNIKPEEKKEIVSSLLERGADPNKGCTIKSIFYTFEAPTALFMAIHYDWPTEIFSQIYKCKMGCDVNIKDTKQRNILSLAASERKPDYMKWLLENCADLSKPESMKLAFKHAGNFITKEYRTLQFFDKGKIKLIPEFDKKTSSRDNTNSK